MKVWDTTLSSTEVQRLIAEQELTIQALRDENKRLSERVNFWMVKFAESQAKLSRIIDGN